MSRKKMPAIVSNFRFKTFFDLQTYKTIWSAQKRLWRLFSAICEGKTGFCPEPAADVPRLRGGFHRPYILTLARPRARHARTLLDKYVLSGEVLKTRIKTTLWQRQP